MKKLVFPKVQIDWPNHLIGFFSALFGILIAFELDEWRERQNEAEQAATAFDRLKTEIEFNQNILQANVKENINGLTILKQLSEKLNDRLLFMGTIREADSVNREFSNYIFIDTSGRNQGLYPAHISIQTISPIAQHTSAWESAKATGVLNFMGYEKVIALSSLYNYSSIIDELHIIRQLARNADDVATKSQLLHFLSETEKSLSVIEHELSEYEQFVNILKAIE